MALTTLLMWHIYSYLYWKVKKYKKTFLSETKKNWLYIIRIKSSFAFLIVCHKEKQPGIYILLSNLSTKANHDHIDSRAYLYIHKCFMTHQILNRHGGQKNSAFLQLVIRILMFLLKPPIMVSQWMKTSQHVLVLMLGELKAYFLKGQMSNFRWWQIISIRYVD